jgi:hypothetical protein
MNSRSCTILFHSIHLPCFPSGIFSKRAGVFYSILAILQVSSLLYIIYHAFLPSSLLPPHSLLLLFSPTTLLLIFRSITLHPRWPLRTVSHWLRELGVVINHCPELSKRKWEKREISFGQYHILK